MMQHEVRLFRLGLAERDRVVLDQLVASLLRVRGSRPGQVIADWPNAIRRAGPTLTHSECQTLAAYALGAIAAGAAGVATPAAVRAEQTQMSFNLQYLQLQNSMEDENRQFAMVSNIMKTKHDTVKNTIVNMR